MPVVLTRLPEDYFSFPDRHRMSGSSRHPVLHILILAIKNLVGALLIFSGILMLVLPGQGLLTIIIGLILKEFPGKYSIERWLVNRHSVLLAINWI